MNGGHVEEIKSRLPIDELIGSYLTLESKGKYLSSVCPFHNEKSASFYVSPDRGTYYCFGCGEKGDIFSFVEKYEGLDFRGALKLLADRTGVTLEPISKEKQENTDRIYSLLETATKYFEDNLNKNPDAKKYLLDRGLTENSIKNFRIGFSSTPWSELTNFLKSSGFSDQNIIDAGLGIKGDKGLYDRFRGRIMFPIEDSSNRVIAYSARILPIYDDGKSGKYVNSPETVLYHKSNILYGFSKAKNNIRKYDFSVLVEGQFDVVLSHQCGFLNTVAVSGTAFSGDLSTDVGVPTQFGILSKLSKNMILALDSDDAGQKAQIKAMHIALPMGINVKLIKDLGDNKDPADILCQPDGISLWKEFLKNAIVPVEALSLRIINKEQKRNLQINEVKKNILPLIAILPTELDKHEASRIVEKYFSIPVDLVLKDVKAISSQNTNTVNQNIQSHPKKELISIKEIFWGLYFATNLLDSVAYEYKNNLQNWLDENIPKDLINQHQKEYIKDKEVLSMKMDIQLAQAKNPELFIEDLKLQYQEYVFRDILSKVKEKMLINNDDSNLILEQREVQKKIEEVKEKRRNI